MIAVLLLALALAADAAAVSAGLGASRVPARSLQLAALLFGLFQAGMAGIGALAGTWLVAVASAWDHWVAFVLLAIIGGRMLWPSDDDEDDDSTPDVSVVALIVLAVATSIDALAAGITVPLLDPPLGVVLAAIGIVTALASITMGLVGRRVGDRVGPVMERIGGVVLIGIGVKILVEHTLLA